MFLFFPKLIYHLYLRDLFFIILDRYDSNNKFIDEITKELYTNSIEEIKTSASKENLTSREKEIFMFIGKGYGNKEIAGEISVDVKTVEKHKSNMMKKLNFKKVNQLYLYAALQILNMSLMIFYILPDDMF